MKSLPEFSRSVARSKQKADRELWIKKPLTKTSGGIPTIGQVRSGYPSILASATHRYGCRNRFRVLDGRSTLGGRGCGVAVCCCVRVGGDCHRNLRAHHVGTVKIIANKVRGRAEVTYDSIVAITRLLSRPDGRCSLKRRLATPSSHKRRTPQCSPRLSRTERPSRHHLSLAATLSS